MLNERLSRVDLDIIEKAADFGFSFLLGAQDGKKLPKGDSAAIPVLAVETLANGKTKELEENKYPAVAFLLSSLQTDFKDLRHFISLHDEDYSIVFLRDLGINFFNSKLILVWRGSNPLVNKFLDELKSWALDVLDPLKLSTKLVQLKLENLRLLKQIEILTSQLSEMEHVAKTKAYRVARRASDFLHNYPTARELSKGVFTLARASEKLVRSSTARLPNKLPHPRS